MNSSCVSTIPKTKDHKPSEGIILMPQIIGKVERRRQEMKEQRHRLFNLLLRNPARVQLAAQIRKIDDKLAE